MTTSLIPSTEPACPTGFEPTPTRALRTLVHVSTSARALQEDVAGSLICAHGVTVYLGNACAPCGRPWS